jgi:predicted transcriptional regulator
MKQMDETITLKIDSGTRHKLDEIADRSERSNSAMIRWLIQREFERQAREAKAEHAEPVAA